MDKRQMFKIPELDPYYYIQKEIIQNLKRMEKLSNKHPVNILVMGKQGCGKSSLVRQFAAYFKRSLATFQIGLLSEPGQLFGERVIKEGDTAYEEYLFPKAIRSEGCVIHLEEINRPEHPKALNELFSVLSEDRSIWIEELGLQQVAEKVIFFATMNEGSEFTGVEFLDAALKDRFYTFQLDYLSEDVEKKIISQKIGISEEKSAKIIHVINLLRNNASTPVAISTRHSLMVAELISMGASIREALVYSLQIGKDELESILISLQLEEEQVESTHTEFVKFI